MSQNLQMLPAIGQKSSVRVSKVPGTLKAEFTQTWQRHRNTRKMIMVRKKMMHVLLVGTQKASLADLQKTLEEKGARITWAESCTTALSREKADKFDLVIVDEDLIDGDGLDCIKKMVSSNPFCNCAAISTLSVDEFHEASEGLGVLMQLPTRPTKNHAEQLLDHLKAILNLTHKNP
jgi:CheY-like chemotaxis protein